jgi:uncharacterized membrane protein
MADTFDVIMAAYQATGAAERDFDALVQLVKVKTVASEGVILVERDAGGEVHVTQTGDHLGRKGLGWGGGVGLVVGLFSPPLLASVVVGAAAGGLAGRFARHTVASGIEEGLGDKLAPGTAVVIAVVDGDDRLAAEQALAGSAAKSVAPMDKKGVGELKAALAEAAGKFSPDRTVLPIPDRAFGEGRLDHTVPVAFSSYAGMDIGRDNGLVVDLAYEDKAPYPFTGTVKKVIFDLKPAAHEDEKALHEHAAMLAIGHGAAG